MQCPKCKKEIPDDAALCCYCGRKLKRTEPRMRRRPNGTGSVYRLNDKPRKKTWAAAKGGVILGLYTTKGAAMEALEKMAGKPIGDAIDLTLEDVFTLWKSQHYPRLSQKGIEAYDIAWDKFAPLKARKMRSLRAEDVQTVVDREAAAGKSRSTLEKIRNLYSQLCKFSMKKDIIDRNYASFLALPKQKAVVREVFSENEIALLKEDAVSCETSRVILILIYTGYRLNELLKKPLGQVDLDQGVMYGGEKSEAGRDRIVPINAEIRAHVEYFVQRATGPLLLSGYVGNLTAHNFRIRNFYPTLERLGINRPGRKLHPHCCRYTFATRGKNAGMDDDALKRIIGHTDFALTSDTYIQSDIDRLRQEMAKMV